MSTRSALRFGAPLIAALCALHADAGNRRLPTVDFDDAPHVVLEGIGARYSEAGFDFTLTGGGYFVMAGSYQPDLINNGTPNLFSANDSVFEITASNHRPFSLRAFDIAGSWTEPSLWFRWASAVVLTGTRAGLPDLHHTFTMPQTARFTTVLLDWEGLSSVTFTPIVNPSGGPADYEFTLDNLYLAAVPEPETWGLLLAGLGATLAHTAWRNRRQRHAG